MNSSRERMLRTIGYEKTDYIPCSFMLYRSLVTRTADQREFIEEEVKMGLDAFVTVGNLHHCYHPDAKVTEWTEDVGGEKYFNRRIDTPKGPLTQKIVQRHGWPIEGRFHEDSHLFNDYICTRAKEVLVKPEEDLDKVKYVLGPFSDEAIRSLREQAKTSDELAKKHGLLQAVGNIGWADYRAGRPVYQVVGTDILAWLSGFEEPMTLSMTDPDLIREYVKITHDWVMRQIEIYLENTNADLVVRRGWYESTEFWTPEAWRYIVAPAIKEEAKLVHQAGRKYGYILTSAFMPIIDDVLDTGIDILIGIDPGEGKGTDFGVIKKKAAEKKVALWGGVSGSLTVELGTEQETEKEVIEAIEQLNSGGFILSPVDNIREDNENVRRNTEKFLQVWRSHR